MSYVKIQRFFGVLLVSVIMAFNLASAQETIQETASEDAILILDASGSMWGQIEGKAKIEIARGVLDELLDEMPTSTRLGLMAYGHTKKGDCSDIELLSEVGANRAAIKKAVKGISPKGKTPIAASVKMAAEKLKYTENKATVILISDGIETCNLDPCALGKQLEKAGVDFTAHVVGFDIADEKTKAQLQCLAESTGGRYLSASNAAELSIALGETVVKKNLTAKLAQLSLRATELPGGPVIKAGLDWKIRQAGGGDIVYEGNNEGGKAHEIPPGVYDVFVTRTSDALKAESLLVEIKPGADKTVTIAFRLEFEASITPDADTIPAGAAFSVSWEGPNRKSDFVTITNIDAPPGRTLSYAYTSRGNPLKLTAPITVGSYEVRYVLGKPYRVLASKTVEVGSVTASLEAPDTADAGSEIKVKWQGPATKSDFITITKPDAKDRTYLDYFYAKKDKPVGKITVPTEPGDYELRYIFVGATADKSAAQRKILARRAITIEVVGATLDAPETAKTGQSIAVAWTGPGNKGDFITVTKPDAKDKAYTNYKYATNGSPSKIRMPLEAGTYELRYVQKGGKVIARAAIDIEDVSASIKGPKTAKVGQKITVEWTGPGNQGDLVTIVKPDARASKFTNNAYAHTKNGSSAEIYMPAYPGEYELRFVQRGKKVIARQLITIEDVTIKLKAPKSAKAGEKISVGWEGQGSPNRDRVTIAPPDAPDSRKMGYLLVRNGNPQQLRMPKTPGEYEIRYLLKGKRVVARKAITIGE